MNKRIKNKNGYKFLAIALIISLVAGVCIHTSYKSKASDKKLSAKERLMQKRNESLSNVEMNKEADMDETVRAVITLESAAVAEKEEITSEDFDKELRKKEKKVIKEQKSIVKEAEKITGNEVVNRSAYLVNSISIDATRSQMCKLAEIDGVEKVYESSSYTVEMNDALNNGNVNEQLNNKDYGYTGEGTVVAILDSGVNYEHNDMKLDNNVKTKYSESEWKDKIKLLGHGEYKTSKVPFGFDYVTEKDDCLDPNSQNSMHGYHVSGITAGNGKINGVAKNAQILGMKVLGNAQAEAVVDSLVKGIEDAVKLGADVINMSLGLDVVSVNDEEYLQKAVNEATKAGVVCCISAGNSGTNSIGNDVNPNNDLNMKDNSTVSTPSIAKNSFSIAAAFNPSTYASYKATGTTASTSFDMSYTDLSKGAFKMSDIDVLNVGTGLDEDEELSFSAEEVLNKTLLINESDYDFYQLVLGYLSEVDNDIIYVTDDINKIINNENATMLNKTVIVVNKETGRLIDNATKDAELLTITNSVKTQDIKQNQAMAYFSSWGPSSNLDIKPEIAGPGHSVYAAYDGKDGYTSMSGTSMSSPFTAGCSAVLLNSIKSRGLKFEGLELNNYIKHCLMNTAKPITNQVDNAPYSIRYQGAGMVDLSSAVDNKVIATVNGVAKVELREVTKGNNPSFIITLTNYGNKEATYTLANDALYTDYKVDREKYPYGIKPVEGSFVSYDKESVTVPANGTATVTATLNLSDNFENNQYVEGYVNLKGTNARSLSLPLLGFVGDWSAETIIDAPVYDSSSIVETALEIPSGTGLVDLVNDIPVYYGKTYTKVAWDDEEPISGKIDIDDIKYNKDLYIALEKIGMNEDIINGNMEKIGEFLVKIARDYAGLYKDLKIGDSEAIKNVYNGYGIGMFKADFTGFVTISTDADTPVEVVPTNLFNLASLFTSNKIKGLTTLCKGETKEFSVEEGQTYVIVLRNNSNNIEKGDKLARVSLDKSDGSSLYTLKESYDKEKIAFSPNGDGFNDRVYPFVTQLRSSKATKIEILDSNKNVIRTLTTKLPVNKLEMGLVTSLFGNITMGSFISYSAYNAAVHKGYINWDGKVYNQSSGKYEYVKDGKYYMNIESKVSDNAKAQTLTMPIQVDFTKPEVKNYTIAKKGSDTILKFNVSDNIDLSGEFYVDIETKSDKISKINTFSKAYLDTKKDANGMYELNLGNIGNSEITCMFEDVSGNQVYVGNEDAKTEDITPGNTKDAPIIEVITDNKKIKESTVSEDGKSTSVVLKATVLNNLDIKIKVTDDDFIEDSLTLLIDTGKTDNISYMYDGDGIYNIRLKKLDQSTNIVCTIKDRAGNVTSHTISLYRFLASLQSNEDSGFEDVLSKVINSYSIEERNVTSDMLNADGTFTIKGSVGNVTKLIAIDGREVQVNEADKTFIQTVAIRPGVNKYTMDVQLLGQNLQIPLVLYYDDVNITLNNMDENTVFETTKGTFNVNGVVTSYNSVYAVKVNGNSIFDTSYGVGTSNGEKLTQNFNTTINLNKGINKINVEVITLSGLVVNKTFEVNYK